MKILKKLLKLLDRKQKNQIIGLIVLMIIGAILEACSVVVIIPVIEVVFQTDAINNNKYLHFLYGISHICVSSFGHDPRRFNNIPHQGQHPFRSRYS